MTLQGRLVIYFKLATCSEKFEILTPLYYINRGIKWGGGVGGLGIEF